MKKLLSMLILLSICVLAFVGCGEPDDNTKIRIGYMAGPTGMGMAKLIHDNGGVENGNEKYSFEKFTNTKMATAALTAGKIDVICLPTNEAADYFNTVDDNTVVLAINTLNTLFLLSDANTTVTSLSELEGKTIYTCKNGTPKMIIEHLLEAADVNATVSTNVNGTEILTPAQLGEQLVAGNIPVAVVPEPIVTSSLLTIKKNGNTDISYSIDLDIGQVWNSTVKTNIAMGCIVANKTFVNEHKSVINSFLKEYKESIDFIKNSENLDLAATYVVETGVMAAAPAAKSALANLGDSIEYIDGKNMKSTLEAFYKVIGISAPKNTFYYEK